MAHRTERPGGMVPGAPGILLALAVVVFPAILPGPASGQEYHVDRDAPRRVAFISRATLDTFEGVTERIDGYVLLDGEGVRPVEGPAGEVYFEVDLASLDTGINLRNRHMRENYLEVDRHPFAVFQGRIDAITATGDGSFDVSASGDFSVHGVSRRRSITCGVTPEGPRFRARCAFPVLLPDHSIDIPRLMFMRLAEEVRVELDVTLEPAG